VNILQHIFPYGVYLMGYRVFSLYWNGSACFSSPANSAPTTCLLIQ